jgi:ribonuclease Z
MSKRDMVVQGVSVAGLETCVEVPSLRLALDMGVCPRTAVALQTVLVSHGHLDHCAALPSHAARRSLQGMGVGRYVVPAAISAQVEDMFNAAGALDGQVIPRQVVALSPDGEWALGNRLTVRPFSTFHRVVSQGYCVWERRKRLLPAFAGLQGAEMGALRARGERVDEDVEVPLLAYTGDTRVEVLERVPELQKVETLVMELSFLDARVSVAQAREMGHVHLYEVMERREMLGAQRVVFAHFSARYGAAEVDTLLRPLREEFPGKVEALAPRPRHA